MFSNRDDSGDNNISDADRRAAQEDAKRQADEAKKRQQGGDKK